ncbi:hypothetical protein SK128_023711, partial [Halocaridina rubra]
MIIKIRILKKLQQTIFNYYQLSANSLVRTPEAPVFPEILKGLRTFWNASPHNVLSTILEYFKAVRLFNERIPNKRTPLYSTVTGRTCAEALILSGIVFTAFYHYILENYVNGQLESAKTTPGSETCNCEPRVICRIPLKTTNSSDHRYYVDLQIGDDPVPVTFLVDTGCQTSTLDSSKMKPWYWPFMDETTPARLSYRGIGGTKGRLIGIMKQEVKTLNGLPLIDELEVTKVGPGINLLGLDALNKFNCQLILSESKAELVLRDPSKCNQDAKRNNLWCIDALFDGCVKLRSVLDTGSSFTILNEKVRIKSKQLNSPITFLGSATTGEVYTVVSRYIPKLEVSYDGYKRTVQALLMEKQRPLLGTDFLRNCVLSFRCGKLTLKTIMRKEDGDSHLSKCRCYSIEDLTTSASAPICIRFHTCSTEDEDD